MLLSSALLIIRAVTSNAEPVKPVLCITNIVRHLYLCRVLFVPHGTELDNNTKYLFWTNILFWRLSEGHDKLPFSFFSFSSALLTVREELSLELCEFSSWGSIVVRIPLPHLVDLFRLPGRMLHRRSALDMWSLRKLLFSPSDIVVVF